MHLVQRKANAICFRLSRKCWRHVSSFLVKASRSLPNECIDIDTTIKGFYIILYIIHMYSIITVGVIIDAKINSDLSDRTRIFTTWWALWLRYVLPSEDSYIRLFNYPIDSCDRTLKKRQSASETFLHLIGVEHCHTKVWQCSTPSNELQTGNYCII